MVRDVAAVDLVRRFMDRPVIGEHVARSDRGLGLHQGSPLSPLLSNLYLDAFDRAMLELGYRTVRYADDIAIPAADRGEAERALADAAREVAELRLELDPVKSQVVSFDAGVPFLGSTVTALTSPGAMAMSHPAETVVYVDKPGSLIRSRGDRMVVEHQGDAVFRLNFKRVRQVVCIGRVGVTTPFLQRVLRDGIEVAFLDEHGGPGGRLVSLAHSDPTARRAQYRAADAITRLVLGDAASYEELLGHEGMASREYFRAWRQVTGEDWGFTSRQRRPPPDPVNAMLSFGYTMLA